MATITDVCAEYKPTGLVLDMGHRNLAHGWRTTNPTDGFTSNPEICRAHTILYSYPWWQVEWRLELALRDLSSRWDFHCQRCSCCSTGLRKCCLGG